MENSKINLPGANEVSNPPTRGELSRALRLAYEHIRQLHSMFDYLVADEADARAKKYLKELARKNKSKQ